ncbi:MAG: ATP-binding cassette domain-containing protein [Planctomycetota bacterium]|nr:ATP-binding cassette domain-containing protein [Planctomycetota bacterium]
MLEICELTKVYPGPVAALQGVDLEIPEGMFGLLGPNGAGKTTLMQIVAGILEPTSGRVLLDGVDVVSRPDHVWERLGYLPQDFGFYGHLSGRAMLTHLLRLKGVRAPGGLRKLSAELLERVNLADAGRRKVKGYSGGMLQRLGIAQAIAGDPRILVVDEPTAGLDPEERLRFYHILAELAQERIVLLSTHIVEDVSVLCSHFAIIRRGRLVARTTPGAAQRAVSGAIWEGDVGAEDLDDLRARHTVLQELLVGGRSRLRIHHAGADVPPGFEPVDATLEDAYLSVMRLGENVLPRVLPEVRPEVHAGGSA